MPKFIAGMVYLMCVLTQIYCTSYFGSRLKHESDGITRATYASQWMSRNERCKRTLRIFVECSSRPMTIFAGGLFELSLPTFLKVRYFFEFFFSHSIILHLKVIQIFFQICKTAYSSYSVLSKMFGD